MHANSQLKTINLRNVLTESDGSKMIFFDIDPILIMTYTNNFDVVKVYQDTGAYSLGQLMGSKKTMTLF